MIIPTVLLALHQKAYAVDIVLGKTNLIKNRKSLILDKCVDKDLTDNELGLIARLDVNSTCCTVDLTFVAASINYESKKNFFGCTEGEAVIRLAMQRNPYSAVVIKFTSPFGYPRVSEGKR